MVVTGEDCSEEFRYGTPEGMVELLQKVKAATKKEFECTVIDLAEGHLHITVKAIDEDAAYEEAHIAASERGCINIAEIIVGSFE